ncbi:unnamed protein product [Paramecium sonneborni]|uniref:Uncharacterized protein n=1 Tax=Paramecium sonneborni TaxID=65129 RepID=A0A8S1P6N8_9CILI|nr:unnamed protein product [Paramecium sonneborni]CAD8098642.1 unnamed protein product [Paramecium sonneborni]
MEINKQKQNICYGSMEFRTLLFCSYVQKLSTQTFFNEMKVTNMQQHILEINSKKFQHICLDCLSTRESDFKYDFENDLHRDMTQSCIF